MRKLALVLAAAALSACDGPSDTATAPEVPTPSAAVSLRADSIHAAAVASMPVNDADGVMIGVLDHGQTPNSNLVLFRTPSESATYRYERSESGWVRAQRVVEAAPEAEPGMALAVATGYSGMIARIQNGSNVVDQWFVSNIKTPGAYYQTEGYGVIVVDRAAFIGGTQISADTQFTVSMGEWRAYRDDAPECDVFYWNSTSSSWIPGPCLRTDTRVFDYNVRPQRFWLRFNLTATALAPLEFHVTDWEANDSEYRAFGISPNTFSGATIQNVVWEVSSNGFSWTPIAASSCGKQYTGAFRGYGPETFIRATVTLGDGRVATRSTLNNLPRYVDVTDVYNMCP